SRPGDLLVDPFAGTGTMLAEAVHPGRDDLRLDIEPGWVSLARTNLALATRQGATGRARIIHADATRLPARVPAGLRGTVDLVLTSAPMGKTMPACRRAPRPRQPRGQRGWEAAGGPGPGRHRPGAGPGRLRRPAAPRRPGRPRVQPRTRTPVADHRVPPLRRTRRSAGRSAGRGLPVR